jgi:hypothetical protein
MKLTLLGCAVVPFGEHHHPFKAASAMLVPASWARARFTMSDKLALMQHSPHARQCLT